MLYRLKIALSCRFLDRTLSLTFSFSMKKQTTCGMVVHRHGLEKSSSEFWFDFVDEKCLISMIAQMYESFSVSDVC